MPSEPTSFELRVEFSGVSLYVLDPGRKKIALLMPDARYRGARHAHQDNTPATPHVGYVRFDLANLASPPAGVPVQDPAEAPSYEVVHRFDHEELRLELPETDENIDAANLALPDFDEFAPVVQPRPELFAADPAAEVLMRTVLRGGTLTSVLETGVQWEISGELHPQGRPIVRTLGGEVHWRRTVNAPGMTLRLVSFRGTRETVIPLRPTTARGDAPAISLKIANLCSNNPLEWGTYEPVNVTVPDTDFKWLYRLLQLRPGAGPILYPPPVLPHPRPVPSANMNAFQDCFGGKIAWAFEG